MKKFQIRIPIDICDLGESKSGLYPAAVSPSFITFYLEVKDAIAAKTKIQAIFDDLLQKKLDDDEWDND